MSSTPKSAKITASAKAAKAAEAEQLRSSILSTLPPLSAERIARGDTRDLMLVAKANGDWKVLFISTDGVTGLSSVVEGTKPASAAPKK